MERKYLVANVTSFPILLKELNIIVPAKSAVNLFELAPELTIDIIKREENFGILGLRLKYSQLVLISTEQDKQMTPSTSLVPDKPFLQTNIKLASDKKEAEKIIDCNKSSKKSKIEKGGKLLHKINNEKAIIDKDKKGMIVFNSSNDKDS